MKREIVGQGAVVVLVVAIVAAVVGGAMGYLLSPGAEVPPEIAELEAEISELEDTVSEQEDTISDLEGTVSGLEDTISELGQSLEDRAKKEGVIVLYHAMDEPDVESVVIPRFKEVYPWAEVQQVGMSPAALAAKIKAEAAAGAVTADVVINVRASMAPMFGEDVFVELDPDGEPMKQYALMDFAEGTLGTEVVGVPAYGAPAVWVYNTELVDEPPTSIEEFTDEKWRGKIVMDPPWALADTGGFLVTLYGVMGESKWNSFIQDFAANDPIIAESTSQALMLLTQGEAYISSACTFDYAAELAKAEEEGRDPLFKPIWSIEPRILSPQYGFKLKNPPHPAMQELFLAWLTSMSGQWAIGATGRPPLSPTVQSAVLQKTGVPTGVTFNPAGYNVPTYWGELEEWAHRLQDIFE